jgi:hypothetical protein
MQGLRVWTFGCIRCLPYDCRVQHLRQSVQILVMGKAGTWGAGGFSVAASKRSWVNSETLNFVADSYTLRRLVMS